MGRLQECVGLLARNLTFKVNWLRGPPQGIYLVHLLSKPETEYPRKPWQKCQSESIKILLYHNQKKCDLATINLVYFLSELSKLKSEIKPHDIVYSPPLCPGGVFGLYDGTVDRVLKDIPATNQVFNHVHVIPQ